MVDILIFGATGFCGSHAARYIFEHSERSKYTVGLAVRNRSKLASVGLSIDNSVQIFELDIFDTRAIENVVKQAKVVLNCVGPYWHYGSPVVYACARNGVHYVDITGETPWILDIIKKYDYLATKTHAIIVPSCGVDSVPADVCVYLASKTLGRAPLGASTTAAILSGGIPPGTIASFLTACEDVPPNHNAMARADWALSPVPGAPSPPPGLVYRLVGSSGRGYHDVGAIGAMARVNRALVQRTAGLLELARRESQRYSGPSRGTAREGDLLCYGPAFSYTEFMPTGSVVRASLFSMGMIAIFATLIFIAPVRWIFKRLVILSGTGLGSKRLEDGYLEYVNVTVSDEPSPRYAKTTIKGRGDPGTLLTAAFVGESALSLLFDKPSPLVAGGGVLTPMFAFGDNLIRRLEANGRFEITTRLVDSPDDDINESRKTR